MKNRRQRTLAFAVAALVAVWLVAWTAYHFIGKTKMTAEKVEQFAATTDFDKLSGADRDKAISDFANMINSLSYEERLKWRRSEDWKKWFAAMTEAERLKFIEATLPTGFQQMMDAFSQMPDDKRKRLIDQSVKRLNEGANNAVGNYGNGGPPPLSPELEQKAREIGIQQLYAGSSAETKAELAPLLEALQQQINSGHMR
jgi:hypothetical protein